jgi:hypothetical protein
VTSRVQREGSQNGTTLHQPPQIPAVAIFYPNFYPNRQGSGVETLYVLVTAANWSGRPECVTSLPSWSCGFGSRRPLSTDLVSKSVSRYR